MKKNRDVEIVAKKDRDFAFDTSALSLALGGLLLLALGMLMMLAPKFVFRSAALILLIFFGVQAVIQLLASLVMLIKARRGALAAFINFLVYVALFLIVLANGAALVELLPILMGVWAAVVALANLVSFLQYAAEKYSKRWKFLFTSVAYALFAVVFFTTYLVGLELSVVVTGTYLILLGVTTLDDAYASATNAAEKELGRSRRRITLPPLLTLMLPASMLKSLNRYIAKSDNPDVDLSILKGETEPNAEVFIHVATTHENFGHVDVCVNGRVAAFGGYNTDTLHLGGLLGRGAFFELNDPAAYIELVRKKNTSVFGFGLVLRDSEIKRIWDKMDEIESRGYIWKPRAQVAAERGEDGLEYHDYASRLYNYCGARFWQFKHGAYKYYFVLGTNCAKTADDLLSAGGLDTVAGGVITPGTYLDYMNGEFQRRGSRVVSRNVYSVAPPKRERREMKKLARAQEKAERAKAKRLDGKK